MERIITGMAMFLMLGMGIYLLVTAVLIGICGRIGLLDYRRYQHVAEENKLAFCRGVGFGNALAGLGLIVFPVVDLYAPQISLWVFGGFIAAGFIVSNVTVLVLNKGSA